MTEHRRTDADCVARIAEAVLRGDWLVSLDNARASGLLWTALQCSAEGRFVAALDALAELLGESVADLRAY